MSDSKAAPGFPYDHLAILGFDRLKRYVPPPRPEAVQPSWPGPDGEEHPSSTVPPPGK
jgi:hypothetical protein